MTTLKKLTLIGLSVLKNVIKLIVGLTVLIQFSCDKNEDINSDEITTNGIKGTGSFVFNDYVPLSSKPVEVYYHVPERANEQTKIVMLLHGGGRDAKENRDDLISYADRLNYILVSPEFSRDYFPGGDAYNLGNVFIDGDRPSASTLVNEEQWTFSLIDPIYEKMKRLTANQNPKYDLFGFSAGAQFVHRLILCKGSEKVDMAVIGAAGWYTVPDDQIDFPYGIAKAPINVNDVREALKTKITIVVGQNDNDPNAASLRRNQYADQQGTDRLSRARHFFQRGQQIATAGSAAFNWNLIELPNVGHDFQPLAAYSLENIITQ